MRATLLSPWPRNWLLSLRTFVTGVMLFAMTPLLIHTAVATWHSFSSTRLWAERDLAGDVEHLARDVDARLEASRSVMRVVAMSPAARRGDLAAMREHLELAREEGLIRAARLLATDGEVLLAVGIDPGAPAGGPGTTGQFLVSNLAGEPVLVAAWPVESADQRLATLEFFASVAVFTTSGSGIESWPWHLTAVADREGEVAWSTDDVGTALGRYLRDPSVSGGLLHSWIAADGHQQSVAFARAKRSGLTVVVGQPEPSLYHRVPFGPSAAGALAVTMVVLSVVLARLGALKINAAYRSALAGAQTGHFRIIDAVQLGKEMRARRDRLFHASGGIVVMELSKRPGDAWKDADVTFSSNLHSMLDLPAATELDSEALIGQLAEEDRDALGALLRSSTGATLTFSRVVRLQRPGAAQRYLNIVGMLREALPGEDEQLVLTLQDVTAQRETELELVAQASRLQLAVSIAGLGVWERDVAGGTGHASERVWEIMGLKPHSSTDMRTFFEAVHPDDRDRVRQAVMTRTERELDASPGLAAQPETLRYRILRADGTVRHVRSNRVFVEDGMRRTVKVVGVMFDETESVIAQRALAASEARFRLAVEVAELGVFERYIDAHSNVGIWNDRMWHIRGLQPRPEPMSYDELLATVHPEDRERLAAFMRQRRERQDGSTEYEFRIIRPDGEERIIHSRSVRTCNADEGSVSIVAINQDITERRRSEMALAASEARFRLATETAGLGVAELDPRTGGGTWNARLYDIFGLAPREDRPSQAELLSLIHPDDRAGLEDLMERQLHAEDGHVVEYECRIVRPDGQERIVHLRNVVLRRPDGTPIQSSVAQDVTERRRAEQALEEAAARFRLAVETADLGFAQLDPCTGKGMWSDRLFRIYGLEPRAERPSIEELLSLIHPDDRARVADEIAGQRAGGDGQIVETEFRIIRPNGQERVMQVRSIKLRRADGSETLSTVTQDVTERRRAVQALAESELRLRLAIDAAGLGIWDYDKQADRLMWSERMWQVRGQAPGVQGPSRDEMLAMVVPEDRGTLLRFWEQMDGPQDEIRYEYRVRRPDGAVRHLSGLGRLVRDAAGVVVRVVGVSSDITEQREAQRALAESEARLRLAVDTAGLGVAELQMATGLGVWNERLYSICGLDPEAARPPLAGVLALVHPEDRARVEASLADQRASGDGQVAEFEFRIVRPDGAERILHVRSALVHPAGGEETLLTVTHDITEQRRAEHAMAESELRLRLATETTGVGIWDYDPATTRVVWSDRLWRLRGLEPEAEPLTLERQFANIVPEDHPVMRRVLAWQAAGEPQFNYDYRVMLPDGTTRHLHGEGRSLRDACGRVVRVVGIVIDVTLQRVAELALRDKTTTLELALEAADLGVWVRDPARDDRDASARVWAMFGQPGRAGQMSSAELFAGIHPEDRDAVRGDWVPATGEAMPRQREFRALWPDGTVRYIQSHRAVLRDHLGKVVRVIGVIADITERREAELALRDRTTTLELAIQAADLGLWLREPHQIDRDASERVWAMFGHPGRTGRLGADELMAAVHPDDRIRLENDWEPAGQDPDARRIEFRLIWPDGQVRHVRSSRAVLRDAAGRVRRVIGVMSDVTEARRATERLEASEARLRLAVETAGLGVFDVDPTTRMGQWSDRMWRMRGLEPRPNKPTTEESLAMVHPDDRDLALKHSVAQAGLAEGEVSEIEVRVVWPDGAVHHIQSRSIAQRGADGRVQRIFGINLDVTESRRAAQELRETAARYELAVDAADLGVFEFDPESRTGYWSDRIWQMRGLPPQPGTLSFDEVIALVHPDERDAVAARMRRQFTEPDGTRGEYEFRIVRPDGTVRHIQSRAITQRRPNGGRHRIFGINLDITERRLAAQALEQSEARLRLASEVAELGVFQFSMPAGVGYWSDRMWQIRGWTPRGGIPDPAEVLLAVHPDDRSKIEGSRMAAESRPHGDIVRTQYRIVRPDGAVRHIAAHSIVLRGREDGHWTLIGVNADVTEQVEREQMLRETAARFELAIDAAELAVWEWNPLTNAMSWSPRIWRMAGMPPLEDVPSPEDRARLVHPADRDLVPSAWIRSMSTGNDGRGTGEFRMVRRDGTIRFLHWQGIPLRDAQGRVVRFAGVVADVTEARLAELALRNSEELFRMAAEAAEQGVWNHDLASNSLTWSARMWLIHGLAPQEGSPSLEERIALVHPEDLEEVLRLREELESGPPNAVARRSYRIIRPDGAVRMLERQAMLVPGPDGRPARIVGVVHDVTEARELSAQAMVADKLATLGEMAGAIAHELAQPLQAVMATAATARMRLDNGVSEETVQHVYNRLAWIERQTARAGKTIQHLLAFSRGESSDGLTHLGNAIEGAMELTGHSLRRAGIEVSLQLPADLPLVRGGQIEIEQVLVNLLNNARDAIGEREYRHIWITIHEEGDSVLLEITDTGGGVPPDRMERIFEPFFTTKPIGRGTGIGLAVVRRTMSAIDGDVKLANTAHGACFTLVFRTVTME